MQDYETWFQSMLQSFASPFPEPASALMNDDVVERMLRSAQTDQRPSETVAPSEPGLDRTPSWARNEAAIADLLDDVEALANEFYLSDLLHHVLSAKAALGREAARVAAASAGRQESVILAFRPRGA